MQPPTPRSSLGEPSIHSQNRRRAGSGTSIRFKPSAEVFSDLEFHYDILAKRLRELSFLNSGVRIRVKDERTNRDTTFEYKAASAPLLSI